MVAFVYAIAAVAAAVVAARHYSTRFQYAGAVRCHLNRINGSQASHIIITEHAYCVGCHRAHNLLFIVHSYTHILVRYVSRFFLLLASIP